MNEADPYVMSGQIEAAVSHGVNVFIYDWYWYDNRPFLEKCLNDGFLKAPNNNKMKFYIMWANHDATHLWDIRNSDSVRSTIWQGAVTREQFEIIGRLYLLHANCDAISYVIKNGHPYYGMPYKSYLLRFALRVSS